MQELDGQSDSGIFLKFGPFPVFDAYVKDSMNRSANNMINEKNNSSNNPMTPDQDSLKLYEWTTSHIRLDENWSVTIPIKETPHILFWRRLKQQ